MSLKDVVALVVEELEGHVDEENPEASLGWCLDALRDAIEREEQPAPPNREGIEDETY